MTSTVSLAKKIINPFECVLYLLILFYVALYTYSLINNYSPVIKRGFVTFYPIFMQNLGEIHWNFGTQFEKVLVN